jgi:photosystem II stability/assembly factor-like uncharacterized protein
MGALCLSACGNLATPRSAAPVPEHLHVPLGADVAGMQLLPDSSGWAISGHRLVITHNAGESWATSTLPGTGSIETAFFLDSKTGWVITRMADGSGGSLFETSNAGNSWRLLSHLDFSSQFGIGPISLTFADLAHGWIVVDEASHGGYSRAFLLRTENGGMTWSRLPMPHSAPVIFTSPLDGYSGGGPSARGAFFTHDGGNSWFRVEGLATPAPYKSVWFELPVFRNANTGVLPATFGDANGNALAIGAYTTQDGGRTWNYGGSIAAPDSLNATLFPLGVADANNWLAMIPTASANSIIGRIPNRTRDGGKTWARLQANVLPVGVQRIEFANSQVGWALVNESGCRSGKTDCFNNTGLLATSDGGSTWSALPI